MSEQDQLAKKVFEARIKFYDTQVQRQIEYESKCKEDPYIQKEDRQ